MKLSLANRLALYARASGNALGVLGRRTDPPAIIWVLTQRCFYQCVHCDSWMDRTPIDRDALLAITDKIVAARTRIVALSGGEPFMVKCLPEIVTRLKRAGKIVTINTNGHLLAEHAEWLTAERVDRVQVSVDGPTAQIHDGIRRHAGSFDTILAGIERVKALRGDGPPLVSVCAVLMKENAEHLVALAERFRTVADAVEIQPLHDSAGLLATAGAAAFTPADRPLVEAQMATLAARDPAFATPYYRAFSRFLFEPRSMEHHAVDHCLPMIFNTLTIREDGTCRICRYPLHERITEKSIREIWNSPARWDLYASLVRNGCGEPCWIRCHIHPSPLPGRALKRVVGALA